jgi:hypothetical protein
VHEHARQQGQVDRIGAWRLGNLLCLAVDGDGRRLGDIAVLGDLGRDGAVAVGETVASRARGEAALQEDEKSRLMAMNARVTQA